jgi:hypothetical protein
MKQTSTKDATPLRADFSAYTANKKKRKKAAELRLIWRPKGAVKHAIRPPEKNRSIFKWLNISQTSSLRNIRTNLEIKDSN